MCVVSRQPASEPWGSCPSEALCRRENLESVRAFRIAYDGRPFRGFQRQPDVPTVEDAVLDALVALEVLDGPDGGAAAADDRAGTRPVPPGYAAAGRTDAGVSALAQTVAFEAPAWLTPRALNGELPGSVRAWAHADAPAGEPDAPADFHATHDATRRAYVYHHYASGDRQDAATDPDRARAVLDRLAGEHDLHNLTTDATGTRRTLETDLTVDGPFLDIRVAAGGFPRECVRRVAGLVREVAAGRRPLYYVDRVLGDQPLDGPEGVPALAPEPLVLAAVEYPGLEFAVDEAAAETARAAFRERRIAAATRTRVAGQIEDDVCGE